jgi:hypothetical protein
MLPEVQFGLLEATVFQFRFPSVSLTPPGLLSSTHDAARTDRIEVSGGGEDIL